MHSWAEWYRTLVAVWAVLGLPGAILAYGFSGGAIELPPSGDPLGWALWLLCVGFLIAPLVLWPLRKHVPHSGLH